MGVKVYRAISPDDYINFITMNSGIKFLSLNESPQGLILTYLEDNYQFKRKKVCLAGYYCEHDISRMFMEAIPKFKEYFYSNEMTIIAVGTSVIFKFVVTPIEGSNWEQFANDIGLTLV